MSTIPTSRVVWQAMGAALLEQPVAKRWAFVHRFTETLGIWQGVTSFADANFEQLQELAKLINIDAILPLINQKYRGAVLSFSALSATPSGSYEEQFNLDFMSLILVTGLHKINPDKELHHDIIKDSVSILKKEGIWQGQELAR